MTPRRCLHCLESKAHVYWSFELQEPFVPHEDLSAEQRNLYYLAHGSDTPGIEGMIRSRFLAPAAKADGPDAVGHYSQATPWNDDASFIQTLDRMTNSAKWQSPVITQGYTSIPGVHFVFKVGGGDEAQQHCLIHGVVHFKRVTSMSCTAADPQLLVSRWQLLSSSLHSEMHQDARFFRFPLTHAQVRNTDSSLSARGRKP